jgi:hypothetical protein
MSKGAMARPRKMFEAAFNNSHGVVPTVQLNIHPKFSVSH